LVVSQYQDFFHQQIKVLFHSFVVMKVLHNMQSLLEDVQRILFHLGLKHFFYQKLLIFYNNVCNITIICHDLYILLYSITPIYPTVV